MAFDDDDYEPAVATDDDEDRRRREGDYPVPSPAYAPDSPAAAMTATAPAPIKVRSNPAATPSADPSAPAPAIPGGGETQLNALAVTPPNYPQPAPQPAANPRRSGSEYPAPTAGTGDLESRLAEPRESVQDAAHGAAKRPDWNDYKPAEPHGWSKFGHIMASMWNPTNQFFNVAPEKRAEAAYKNATSEYEAPIGEEFKESEISRNDAEAQKDREAANLGGFDPIVSGDKSVVGFRNQKTREILGPNSPSLTPAMRDIMTAAKPVPPKPDTATQNKETFQHNVGVLRGEGLLGPADVADPKKIAAAVTKSKQLTDSDKNAMVGYLAANPTPATSVTVNAAEGANKDARAQAGKYYTYNAGTETEPNIVLVTGDKLPQGAEAVPVKDPQAFIGEAENANIVTKSFNHLAKHDLSIFDNGAARAILQTALSDEGAKSMGLLIAGTGGSITMPAGMNKMIDTALENHALDEATGRKVKDYIVDYWAAKDKLLMVQMAMQNGKMGKGNKQFFDAMLSQLPGPSTPDSTAAKRQLADFQETLHGLKAKYPDKYGSYRKESDEELKHAGEKEAGGAGGGEQGKPVMLKGQLVGHTIDGKTMIPLAKPGS